MKPICGICEYCGDIADAPAFLRFQCTDTIRRLVWIREHERQTTEVPVAMSAIETTVFDQAAVDSAL
jgi:hypothetical protein